MNRSWLAPTALAVAALSLAVNGYLLWQLAHPGRLAARAFREVTGGEIDTTGVIRYTVRIPAGTPLNLDIPVDETFRIRVDTVLPVRTTARIPIRGPLGTAYVNVPIRSDVPLRTQLPLRVRHTFRLRTRTTRPIEVPLQFRVSPATP